MKIKLRNQKIFSLYPFKVSLFSLLYPGITLNNGNSIAAATFGRLNKCYFNAKSQQLEISLSSATTPEYFYLDQPPPLVVDLPNTKLGNVDTQKNYPGTIQRIRVSQYSPNITRIVIDLKPEGFIDGNQVKLQPLCPKNPNPWVLRPIFSYNSTSLGNQPFMILPPSTLKTLLNYPT
ncbi:AMIN domain-containing protein [Trichormus azollae]|jgi:N-acetylmuramoyl-L-alanine amidase|uniref:AMIN domain-containing protein n=1 Tax=Nostoc azollae (strain 0708) TaxID=551115 RepID=D7DYW8_NOSA0|nr:AMIN domain-containing protein [Trichormus azollae]ADI64447.1 hypothetical protein Aazo_2554 ['Nostoc azollae' 0708]